MLANIRKRRRNPKVCGWSNTEVPMVCCPRRRTTTSTTETPPPPTTTLRPEHISRISPKACGRRHTSISPEYQQGPYPVETLPSSPVQGAPLPDFILHSPQSPPAPSPIASPFPIYGKPPPPLIQAAPSPPANPFPIYGKPPQVQAAPSPVVAKMPPPEAEMFPSSGMESPETGGAVLHEPLLEEFLDQGIEPRSPEPVSYSGAAVLDEEEPSVDRVKIFTVGGESADKIWPWMVAIFYGNSSTQLCGGTLIDDRHIITAAHCFVGKR
ncbi:uncharacterized protein LOC129229713 [Uloborus diversus]|uniref:uncharacterized protein LOC129229713 n=1 Tax=Uloborus diversus TaxID=327109 RepID=UPI00240A3A92|nr:uncharacterized protein LOC129229713 [Uloborus diversus]